MTLIYIPQRIETAEQAEALPIGTMSPPDHPEDHPAVKITRNLWVSIWDVDDDHDATYDVAPNGHMIGSIVLVPVKAHTQDHAPIPGWGEHVRRHRHVTAWLPGPPPTARQWVGADSRTALDRSAEQ